MSKKNKIIRTIAIFLAFVLIEEAFFPTVALALGSPIQAEYSSFEPVETSEMVNLFTGDFVYNIPLLDVGGYPINLSYHAGIAMDQDAGWTGLGWTLNAGAVLRNMRGLPDDFNGDAVIHEQNIKPNKTYGAFGSWGAEIAGYDGLSLAVSKGVNYNNYVGVGFEQSVGVSFSAADKAKGSLNASIGLNMSSYDAPSITPSIGSSNLFAVGLSANYNSREGLKSLTVLHSVPFLTGLLGFLGIDASSSTINYATKNYVPQIQMPMINKSVSLSVKSGLTAYTIDGTVDVTGYYSVQEQAAKHVEAPSYGYMNYGNANENSTLDFNREKDGTFNKYVPSLPVTIPTFDTYSAVGQGISSVFRAHRSDIGTVYDRKNNSISESDQLGAEIKSVATAQGGIDYVTNDVITTSGKWINGYSTEPINKFTNTKGSGSVYEPYYLKEAGELGTDEDWNLYQAYGGTDVIRMELGPDAGTDVNTTSNFIKGQGTAISSIPSNNKRNTRKKRHTLFSTISKGSYSTSAVQKGLANSICSSAKSHHIAEISTTKPDGTRYIYGLPVYNTKQKEVSFNASGLTPANGIITYSGSDNTTGTSRGIDNFYHSTEIPPYATAYLLTAVLSTDYIDLTGNGPSDDDLGDFTRFSYERVNNSHGWRSPFGPSTAQFNEGLKSIQDDDRGNYIFGTKELWYLKKIETKNYIATFELADRNDGYGVLDENGTISSTSPAKYLKKISLYAKTPENITYPGGEATINSNATPIKEVHFVYDYSLCTGVPSNIAGGAIDNESEINDDGGKLTLRKVYFTYQNSHKARLSPYIFNYTHNYPYSNNSYDRWGTYKSNNPNLSNNDFPFTVKGNTLSTSDPNYDVNQNDKTQNDVNASVWCLNDIKLPTGGKIKVQFESDDYAYVQNKQAMNMFTVSNISEFSSANPIGSASPVSLDFSANSFCLFFKLTEPISGNQQQVIYDKYLKNIDDLYFKVLIKTNRSSTNNGYEYVEGYIPKSNITGYGVSTYNSNYGYLQIAKIQLNDCNNCNTLVTPFTKAALQFARIHTPQEAYSFTGGPNPNADVKSILLALADVSLFNQVLQLLEGANLYLYNQPDQFGRLMDASKSWIRLNNPEKKKIGGEYRVKKIIISDGWSEMTSQESESTYGQEYSYTTTENGQTISAGVAAYEPVIGGEENPWKQPVSYNEEFKLAPDHNLYMEEPFGESYFPAPVIGYRKVTVKNLQRYKNDDPAQGLKVKKHATGKVVHEFFTSFDFPVFTKRTIPDKRPTKSGLLSNILKLNVVRNMTCSQGFVVELNDMHGKPKAQWVYAENQSSGSQAPISGIEYKYRCNGNKLNNDDLAIIDKNGNTSYTTLGVDFDVIMDSREMETNSSTVGGLGNLYGFLIGFIPIILPPCWPMIQKEKSRFRSITINKSIYRYGIMEEIKVYDENSVITTKNLAYDKETGNVLLTRTQNEFSNSRNNKDYTYSLNYPAYWAYDGMGTAYSNIGLTFIHANTSSISGASSLFSPGDEVIFTSNGTPIKCWITSINGSSVELKDINGTVQSSSDCTLEIIRSGRKNILEADMAHLVTRKNPLDINNDGIYENNFASFNSGLEIINASATEYSDTWRTFCDCKLNPNRKGATYSYSSNPYISGIKGNWITKRGYVFVADRYQSKENNNSNIRKDGYFTSFSPFWKPNSNGNWNMPSDLNSSSPSWSWGNEITERSPSGANLESRDALNRYSSSQVGYSALLPVATTVNAKYKQMGAENFEDYFFNDCLQSHFGFKAESYNNINDPFPLIVPKGHTGKSSIRLSSGQSKTMTKPLTTDCN